MWGDWPPADWRLATSEKSTLYLHRDNKMAICKEAMFHNGVGNKLLFDARAGTLWTLTYRRW